MKRLPLMLFFLALPMVAQAGWGVPFDGAPVVVTVPAKPATAPGCVPRPARPCPAIPVTSQDIAIMLVRDGVAITTLERVPSVMTNVEKTFTITDNRVRSGDWVVVEANPSMIRPEECSPVGFHLGEAPPHHSCPCYSCRGPVLNGERPAAQWFRNMR